MSKSIIVLGMHRSRTSLVAKVLMELGVFMGNAFRKPDKSNPYGYWEDIAWRNINKTLLNASGHTWWDPPTCLNEMEYVFHGIWKDVACMAGTIIGLRNTAFPIWGFKDPRTILNIMWYNKLLPDPHYVVVTRNTVSTLFSLRERSMGRGYFRSKEEWLDLIDTYDDHLKAFIASGNNLKVHTVSSDDLLIADNPGGTFVLDTIASLAEFIGVQAPDDIQAFMQKVNKLL